MLVSKIGSYLWPPNSGNYVEFLVPVVVTKSEISPLRLLIPGILNSGGGNLFSLGFVGVWVVYMVGSLVSP